MKNANLILSSFMIKHIKEKNFHLKIGVVCNIPYICCYIWRCCIYCEKTDEYILYKLATIEYGIKN